jgi:hypothetical protein
MPRAIQEPGAQDPELKNSPIAGEMDEDREFPRQNASGTGRCYFNGLAYEPGTYIRSGAVTLRCQEGIWVEAGPGDPENP